MNRIAKRAGITLILALVLLGGIGFFIAEYLFNASDWVSFPGSPHVYNAGNIGCGTVTDRSGEMLMKITDTRQYAEDSEVRKSTLHWLGDREGNISSPALAAYSEEMIGYDLINGVYSYGGNGGTAEMTFSAKVQQAALEALDGRKGTVAVYNYKTGEILCAVTTPTYDPDDIPEIEGDEDYDGVYLNRFTQVAYVPGSIFKIVTAAAALESRPELKDEVFECTGEYLVDGNYVTCEDAHGEVEMGQALTDSCNCYFAHLMEQLGGDALMDYAERSGISDPISFDGVTTADGNLEFDSDDLVQVAWSAIGQHNDLVNPCRFMSYVGAIANGGSAAKPYVVSSIRMGRKNTYKAKTEMMDPVITPEAAQQLQTYLRNNVINKYGDENFPGLTVCGKSGTAEVGDDEGSHSLFAGFTLDKDYPLAFITVVEHGGYGRHTCVPILSQVLQACKEVMDGE